jgi:hypothetical protein
MHVVRFRKIVCSMHDDEGTVSSIQYTAKYDLAGGSTVGRRV